MARDAAGTTITDHAGESVERAAPSPALGVGTPLGYGIVAPDLVRYARAADEAGLDDISLGELRSTEVFALATAMVAATRRIRVETSIVAAVTRAPTLLAMGAATLRQLSGGRFRLGLGAGSPIVAGWHGADFAAPLSLVERTVADVRSALAGGRLDRWGSFRIAPEMVGDVPITLSAMNARMLRLAGRVADGVILQFCDPAEAARMGGIARAARADAGVASPFEVAANVWGFAGSDRAEAERAFRREIAPYLAVPTYRAAAIALSSTEEVDAVAEAWRAGGRDGAASAVPQALCDALLFVLGEGGIADRLRAYAAAGVDRVRLVPITPVAGDTTNAFGVVEQLGAVRERLVAPA